MRILYLTEEAISFDEPLVRGGAIHVKNVVQGLRERGHTVDLLDWNNGSSDPGHRSIHPWSRFVEGGFRTLIAAIALGRKRGYDVLISKTRKTYLPGFFAAKSLGLPHIVHVGTQPVPVDSTLRHRLDNASFAARLRLPHDGYLVVCDAIRNSLVDQGIDNQLIYDVRNAVDGSEFSPETAVKLPRHIETALPDSPRVGYVGGLHEYKGVFDLADAVEHTDEPFSLVVVGDGPARRRLESRLSGEHVFLGAVPYRLMPALYRRFDVLVLPSHTEGLPRVILEAQASGTTVVATAVGGVPEVVENEETGLLVPPHSPPELAAALDRALGSTSLRQRLESTARTHVTDELSWSRLYDRYESALKDVID